MHKLIAPFAAAVLICLAGPASASDPIGAYVLVDRVVLEPSEEKPERIQIWGAFALAQKMFGEEYAPPVRGYMYFTVDSAKADVCRKEWADIKKAAGKAEIIGYGSRYKEKGRIRKVHEKAANPDTYVTGFGLSKHAEGDAPGATTDSLLSLPAQVKPAEGDQAEPGKVKLVASRVLSKKHAAGKYVFEIVNAAGDGEVSEALATREKEISWTPKMEIKAGEKYTWRVRIVDGTYKGPLASAEFMGKKAQ